MAKEQYIHFPFSTKNEKKRKLTLSSGVTDRPDVKIKTNMG